jgi:hypothetical protein
MLDTNTADNSQTSVNTSTDVEKSPSTQVGHVISEQLAFTLEHERELHRDLTDDHDEPHDATFVEEDNIKSTPSVWAAVLFLGPTFKAAIGLSFSAVVAISGSRLRSISRVPC